MVPFEFLHHAAYDSKPMQAFPVFSMAANKMDIDLKRLQPYHSGINLKENKFLLSV